MSYIRVDLNAVESGKPRLNQNAQACSQLNGKVISTLNQVDSSIASRRSLRYRMNQTAQRIAEVDRRMRELNGFIQTALEQYGGTERNLSQQAQTVRSPTPLLHPGLSLSPKEMEELKASNKLLAGIARAVLEWLDGWRDKLTSTRTMPIYAATPVGDGPQLLPYDPSKSISEDDILNRDDPEACKRLMEGPFGKMSEEERRAFIRMVEKGHKDYERSMEKYEYGHSFADGFGHGIEKSIQGLVDMVSHPIQTGKAMYEGARDGVIRVVNDPIGVAKDSYDSAKETVVDFIEAGPGKKGDYIGSLFTGLIVTRGLSKVPSLFKSKKPDAPNQAGHGHHDVSKESQSGSFEGTGDASQLYRRTANTGVYKDLEVPMQLKEVENIASQAGIGLDGIKIRIVREPELVGKGLYGWADPKGKVIELYPDAFTDTENLVKTLGHERTHIYQTKTFGAPSSDNLMD